MGVTRPISAAATRLKGKVLVSVLLFSMLFVFLYCPPTKADFAPVSSNTLNLSAEFGASWAKDDIPYSLVTVSSTNVTYLAGSTASFGAGGSDDWLIKVSSQLNVFPGIGSYYMDSVTWRKTYGGPQDELARSAIQSTDGNLVLAGQTKSYGAGGSDIYLLKVDLNGNMLWNATFGGPQDDGADCVVQATDGGYILAGFTSSGVSSQSAWLVKTDSSGRIQWNRTYPGSEANSIIRTSEGGYVLATKYGNAFELVKLDSSGQIQWSRTYAGNTNDADSQGAIQTSDGGYAVAGWTRTSAGSYSARLIKTDSVGNVQWDRTYAGLGAYAVVQTSDGGYALTGDRAFLLITDSLGNVQWNRNYDGLSEDNLQFTRAYAISQPSPNQFLMTGTQQSYGQILTGLDGFLVRVTLRTGDVTPPKITVISPENKIYTTSNVPLICSVDKPTVWLAYQIDNGGNVTISGNTTITLPDGRHNMTVYAADALYNNGASNTVFFSNFAVDTVPINVKVTSIQNATYASKDVPLSFTVDKTILWASYSLDGSANVTAPQNTILTGLSSGAHTLTVYAQDTIGLVEASDTFSFVVADNTIPELPSILIVAFAIFILSALIVLVKARRGRRNADLNVFAFVH